MRPISVLARASLQLVCGSLCLALALPLAVAAPEGEPPPSDATTKPAAVDPAEAFKSARALWEAGNFAAALPLFQQALESSGSPNARIYVARCLRDLGRLPEAYQEMSRTVRDAMAMAVKEERYIPTRDTAAAELALLEQRVGKVVVALHQSLAGAKVLVNGAPQSAASMGQPVVVSPGAVRVVATAANGTTVQRDVDVPAGTMLTVTLAAPAPSKPPPPVPARQPDAVPDDDEGFGTLRMVGIGVAAVGVVGFVVFGITRAQADAEIATLEDDCGPGPCTDPTYADVVDRGKTAETISGISLGVGIAGVLAGTALIVFGGPTADDGAPDNQVAQRGMSIAIGPGPGIGIGVMGRF